MRNFSSKCLLLQNDKDVLSDTLVGTSEASIPLTISPCRFSPLNISLTEFHPLSGVNAVFIISGACPLMMTYFPPSAFAVSQLKIEAHNSDADSVLLELEAGGAAQKAGSSPEIL